MEVTIQLQLKKVEEYFEVKDDEAKIPKSLIIKYKSNISLSPLTLAFILENSDLESELKQDMKILALMAEKAVDFSKNTEKVEQHLYLSVEENIVTFRVIIDDINIKNIQDVITIIKEEKIP